MLLRKEGAHNGNKQAAHWLKDAELSIIKPQEKTTKIIVEHADLAFTARRAGLRFATLKNAQHMTTFAQANKVGVLGVRSKTPVLASALSTAAAVRKQYHALCEKRTADDAGGTCPKTALVHSVARPRRWAQEARCGNPQ